MTEVKTTLKRRSSVTKLHDPTLQETVVLKDKTVPVPKQHVLNAFTGHGGKAPLVLDLCVLDGGTQSALCTHCIRLNGPSYILN